MSGRPIEGPVSSRPNVGQLAGGRASPTAVFGYLFGGIAAVLHSWYSGNSMARPGNAAFAFRTFGIPVLLASVRAYVWKGPQVVEGPR